MDQLSQQPTQDLGLDKLRDFFQKVRLLVRRFAQSRALPALIFGSLVFIVALALSWGVTQENISLFVVAGFMGLIFGLMVLLKPEYGVFFLIFFIYANLSSTFTYQFGLPSLNKPLVGLIAVSVLVSRFMMAREKVRFNITTVFMVIYGAALLISSFVAEDGQVALDGATDFIKDLIIFILIINVADNEKDWRGAMSVFLLAGTFLASLSAYQGLSGDYNNTFWDLAQPLTAQISGETERPRLTGPLGDPNFYAQILVMSLPLAIYRVLDERTRNKKLYYLYSVFVLFIAIMFTYSRGAMLALVLIAVLIAVDRKVPPHIIALTAATFFLVIVPLLPKEVSDRFSTLNFLGQLGQGTSRSSVRSVGDESFQGRTSEMIIAVQMFMDHPLVGVGFDNYPVVYQSYSKYLGIDTRTGQREAHSLYLEVGAETGLMGYIGMGGILITTILALNKASKMLLQAGRSDLNSWVKGLRLGVYGYLFTSIFLHQGFPRYLWMLLALSTAAEAVAQCELEKFQQVREEIEKRKQARLSATTPT
jgi:putative inorganic carbon (HCO3(-)) transporter